MGTAGMSISAMRVSDGVCSSSEVQISREYGYAAQGRRSSCNYNSFL
jgi:hypothetical protein